MRGVLCANQRSSMSLRAKPEPLATAGRPVLPSATCQLTLWGRLGLTHDTTERLSFWPFVPVPDRQTLLRYEDDQTGIAAMNRSGI